MNSAATALELRVTAKQTLSYAMAHNRSPVIERIDIRNDGPARSALDLVVDIRDADGIVGPSHRQLIDVAAVASTILRDVPVRLDPAAMLQIDEQRPGQVEVRLEHAGEVLARVNHDAQLLAAKQWTAHPMPLSLEMLAAFVLPNDPAVEKLLGEASTILVQRTGSPSLEGYQAGSERVDHIVRAIFEALQARHIRYAEPPASWADEGQKVRTPSDVLDGHIGTCLDTTVVLAAALEQAGIHPLLWVVRGHAFLGYWRQPVSLNSTVTTDVREVVNLVDLDHIQLVETTMVAAGDNAHPFDATHRPPYTSHLSGDLTRVLGVVDVKTARENRIVPLPARRRTDAGIEVFEYRPRDLSSPSALPPRPSDTAAVGSAAPVPPRVQQWKNTLLDLSLRNRLINFTERARLDVRVPDGRLSEMEDTLHAQRPLQLLAGDQVDDVHRMRGVTSGANLPEEQLAHLLASRAAVYVALTSDSYASRMRSLAHKARTIVEETGANNLYLTLGTLVWELDGRELRSPLILVPIHLTSSSRGQTYRMSLDESGTSTPNYCLLEKLRQVNGLELPGLAGMVEDDYGMDVEGALRSVRRSIADKNLPYRVEEDASLAILQFAKFRLWKDLDDHWSDLLQNSLVRHLVETPTEEFLDPVPSTDETDLDALDALCPIPADASQLEAVRDAVHGNTFVLEGPPGTGKSQTITNLLTRAIASGKRVLFVAEKRAALDVVSSRLESVGMRPFCLDLHDKGSKPAVVRAQVKGALAHAVSVDEEGLQADQESLRSARRNLSRYAHRLHERNPAGLSYYSARSTLLARGEDDQVLDVPRAFLQQDRAAHDQLRAALQSLPDTAEQTNPRAHHQWGFVTLSSSEEQTVARLHAAARAVDEIFSSMSAMSGLDHVLRAFRTPEDLATLVGLLRTSGVSLSILDETRSAQWQQATSALSAEVAAFVAAAHPGLDRATPAALDLPLADLHAQAQAAAASSFFGRKKRLRAVLDQLTPTLHPGAAVLPKEVPNLTGALLQVQGAVRGLASRVVAVPGLEVPSSWNPLTSGGVELVERQVGWLRWAGKQVETDGSAARSFAAAVRDLLQTGITCDETATRVLEEGERALRDLLLAAGPAAPQAWADWLGNEGALTRWQESRQLRGLDDPTALSLRNWVSFLAALEPLRIVDAHEAHADLRSGRVPADEAAAAWERGLATVSLLERAQATGLDGFDPQSHDRTVERFARTTKLVREHMVAETPRHVLVNRPFQSSSSRGRVGALQRELSKQRGGLGVRALLAAYGDLITQVMPCVLVSPDSAARFFPVGGTTFDVVVFDEASQIRVAEAVGAMGRAKSAIIVGDSKQMPPTVFGESLSETSVDDDPLAELVVEDQESILSEAVDARVPQKWLSWHYRSQDESLIAFSNRHYYEDRLSSFPAPVAAGSAEAHGFGVSLCRVDGQFMRTGKGKLLRTNPVEAEAIVEEIKRRFNMSVDATPSIGVVTFNQQQRAHIEGLLRDSGEERLVEALDGQRGEGLFVKNLENVQGDERDVILFSTAFSVNDKGVLPLNFGPLSRAGGERRLNVAVTRARRQVIIFSSFDPGQLRADETQAVGIKHLRAYLDLAASGPAALQNDGRASTVLADRHRDEIASALRQRGLVVHTNVGLSEFKIDLTVARASEPDQPLVAVLLDGDGWARRRTVGDRDGLPVQILEGMLRWPAVERVWMPAWLSDRDGVLDRISRAVAEAHLPSPDVPSDADAAPADTATSAPPVDQQIGDVVAPAADEAKGTSTPLRAATTSVTSSTPPPLPGEDVFVPWSPARHGGREVLDALPSAPAAILVRRALETVVEAEGPIQHERLAKLVAASFDLARVRQDRTRVILSYLPARATVSSDPGFAWPRGVDPSTWTRFRRASADAPRPIDQVSLRELGNAMVALAQVSAGIEAEELLREALLVFGGKRLTAGITQRLKDALRLAEYQQRLARDSYDVLRPI